MNRSDCWKLADRLNVYQIVLLIVGYDPADFEQTPYQNWKSEVQRLVSPYLNSIQNAVRGGRIAAEIAWTGYQNEHTDWPETLIDIESLRDWLRSRNFGDGFFVPSEESAEGLHDPLGPFYAPKLAAAVHAWSEVTADPEALNGKTPKKAIETWLRKHANEYGLTQKDGNPNELGIEEVSKVANWKPQGGASRTPIPLPKPSYPEPKLGGKEFKASPAAPPTPAELDEEIPF